ncbi:MAG: type II toxin-antitoxin system RelE/ParE family toxin [Pseudomonadota bacterium]
MWEISLSEKSKKIISKLDNQTQSKILNFLNKENLKKSPKLFGKALTSNLKGLWRYRVGDYRIICDLQEKELVVLVIEINHRSKIYK